jgi:hypothetical protein
MHKHNLNRVEYYSVNNLANGLYLSKAEPILKSKVKYLHENINDVLELYNIKLYIDNKLYLKTWTNNDIKDFNQKVQQYGIIVGKFMSKINDENVIAYYDNLESGYINSFWELVNNQKIYKNISNKHFKIILEKEPHEIRNILTHKHLVEHYKNVIRDFLLNYSNSAELLLNQYEKTSDFQEKTIYFPQNLTTQDKENIISIYIDSENVNPNYLGLIKIVRDKIDFRISAKIRLKAKRREKEIMKKYIEEKNNGFHIGVSISFPEKADKIKDGNIENFTANYSYSLDFIKKNNNTYCLFQNFKILFEYLDFENRINLVSKKNQMGVMERVLGLHSQNEYRQGIQFRMSEMTSHCQIVAYNKVLTDLDVSLESVLQNNFTFIFKEKYQFASNARLIMPSANISYLEKVRVLAPEFESVLKQYKLFVEDGNIDFELLQITSSSCAIKDIPSLIKDKYIYLNEDNKEIIGISNMFFSDQTLLADVEPYKDKHYHNFFDLLVNEQVFFNNYEEHQKPELIFLIDKGFIFIDENNFVKITNLVKVLILKDLYNNEVGSYYHYSLTFQKEVQQMVTHNMVFIESSLFSKPEQNLFNYFLNKSEFTNGLDLRNSYLHGTQANSEEVQKHEYAYFTYLKLLVLALLKIEDDLLIAQRKIKSEK